MKLLMEQWRKYLNEIGDLFFEPYPFKYDQTYEGAVFYTFTTDAGSRYDVGFTNQYDNPEEEPWTIGFDVEDSTEMTNENQPLKIMSTIVAVINEFIHTPKLNEGNLKFVFEGIPKLDHDDIDFAAQTGRTKLYLKFLKKNLPKDWDFGIAGKNIIFFGDHIFWEEEKAEIEDEEGEEWE
jgi:hypothetical protein